MNKKVIGVIIAIVVILVAIIGVFYLINNDSLNKESKNNDSSKVLETALTTDEERTEEQAVLNNNVQEQNVTKNTESSKKILIAYFSRPDENYNVGIVEVGNTEIMAGFIKDYLGDTADTFKIDPVKAYPKNYKECTEVATEEKNSNARPEFKNENSLNIDNYDTIFIGYPIWWGDVPMIINTFLEKYNFSGKTIIPFCTHEGSGNAGTFTSLKSKMSSSHVNTDGLAIRGTEARKESSRSTVENWLKGLGY